LALPRDPNVIWATCYGNTVTRYDARQRSARHVSPGIHTLDSEPTKTKYRCHWTPPLAIDPFDEETVYYGCQVIFKTTDKGQSWSVISPDLSTQDPRYVVSSGGVIGDNLGQFYGEVVFAIAPSPIKRGLIWAGTNDGKLWYTADGGGNWTDVTRNINMPAWGTIRRVEPSTFDANVAYVAVDYHMMDNREPYIFKTSDLGKSWTRINSNLPSGHPLDYVLTVAENPNRRGMLFAGTGHGFFYSMDDGGSWKPFMYGLPTAPVTWIAPQKFYHDLVISTYGRGIFVLRDITTLEQSDKVTAETDVFLYEPRAGVRGARDGSAEFLYQLKSPGNVQFEIMDASGKVIRRLQTEGRAGLNRMTWNLRHDNSMQVALRTTPPDNPHIWEESRFKGRDTRPIIHWGISPAQTVGPIAAPGRYSVKLTAAGKQLTQPFDVVKDPSVPASDADLLASTEAQKRAVAGMNQSAEIINRLEVIGKQIEDLTKANQGKADVVKELDALEKKRMDVVLQLLSRTDLHSDDKWYVEAYKVYMNLIWLYAEIGPGGGDVQGGSDYRPTNASMQTLGMLEQQLATAKSDFDKFLKELAGFNQKMSGKLAPITDRPVM
jgi:hypothetical protein